MYNFIINEKALDDIENAYEYYYLNANPAIAERFYSELQSAYAAIQLNPNFQTRSGKFRGFPMQKFPFILRSN